MRIGTNPPIRHTLDLVKFPPQLYLVVHHPDVQLTPEEWLELKDYKRVESSVLCGSGVVGFLPRPDAKVVVEPVYGRLHDGRYGGLHDGRDV